MTDSLTRLRRRPMLAPLLLPLFAVIVAGAGVVWLSMWARTTVIVMVPHAEAAVSNTGDPDLSPAGERRAAQLGPAIADALAGRTVDHLYAADTRRAQQTAASVANQFKLPMNLLAGSDWSALASRIRRDHRGETVVVVGYASTLPAVLNHLTGGRYTLESDDHGSMFLVVLPSPGQPGVVRLRYGGPSPTAAGSASR